MKLASSAFTHEGRIPEVYTCEGKNISPPLTISDVPSDAQSLVLLMDDPDIPQFAKDQFNIQVWDHWVIYNIPPDTTDIPEATNPKGTMGRNTRGNLAYGGPCPPDRKHRYFFKLYALDIKINKLQGLSKKEVEKEMKGHIIAETTLMGTYEKRNK